MPTRRIVVALLRAAAVSLATVAVGVLASLAANAATSDERWPGPLDWIRTHSWQSVGYLAAAAFVLAFAASWATVRGAIADPPPPPATRVPEWVVDRLEGNRAVAAVRAKADRRTVAITTSLEGAGGFGKTTMAGVVCAHPKVRRHFRRRVFTITVGRDVRGRAAIAAKVAEATRFITGDTTAFDDPALAGAHLGRLLDQRPRTLLVLDDVWEAAQLAPFLLGGTRCVRLVTTRVPSLLPPGTARVTVDEMTVEQARRVLTWQLPPLPPATVRDLLAATGRWALLLRLANRLMADQIASTADPSAVLDAAESVLANLRARGPAAADPSAAPLDLDDPQRRALAVRATVEAATTLLPPGGAERLAELGVFVEDEAVPIDLIARLWQSTAGLSEAETRTLCGRLGSLSLVTLSAAHGGRVTLHDVLRDYLRGELGPTRLTALHGVLVDAAAATVTGGAAGPSWWELADGYLLDHLVEHLHAADRTDKAEQLAGDIRWVETRLLQRGPSAPWSDLARLPGPVPAALARDLTRASHLLGSPDTPRLMRNVLHSRLEDLPHWQGQVAARRRDPGLRPYLANRHRLPDLPDDRVLRSLTGFVRPVAAVATGGGVLATAEPGAVRLWNPDDGTCVLVLPVDGTVDGRVAVAPDGAWVLAADARRIRMWATATGAELRAFPVEADTWLSDTVAALAVSPDGSLLVTASVDHVVTVWETASGHRLREVPHAYPVEALAIAPDSSWFATCSGDTTRLFETATGRGLRTLSAAYTGAHGSVAVGPSGAWLVTQHTDGPRIWGTGPGAVPQAIRSTTGMDAQLAVAQDGRWIVTAGRRTEVWDVESRTLLGALDGRTTSVAIAPDGAWIAVAGEHTVRLWEPPRADAADAGDAARDITVLAIAGDDSCLVSAAGPDAIVWDPASGTPVRVRTGHTAPVTSLVVAHDGSWAASGASGSLRLWDTGSGADLRTLFGSRGPAAVTPDGHFVAAAADDGTAGLWEVSTGRRTQTFAGAPGTVTAVAVLPGRPTAPPRVITGTDRGALALWDPVSGARIRTFSSRGPAVEAVAAAGDGRWLASATADGSVRLWDPETGLGLRSLGLPPDGGVTSLAASPDGRHLATTGRDATLRIWEAATGDCAACVRVEAPLRACGWHSDGTGVTAVGTGGLFGFAFHA
ncbi:NB-ARC domain-containing protein [Streptomyces sp. NPDC057680]|uniref:NB-ARC domain-containing protein n=1 Tax=Streptomyces sp. NPDC057680 TaxID=3346208 RepID=UPI003674273A